ncbi:MAG: GNAT family N-acetyltransferase [Gluconacetobacter diazotrophicus]|nr:GNAT family N-acetyltransferase [Gluconacetobacter diazotrophicus]
MAELLRMPGAAASVRNGADEEPAGLALWRVAADEAELLTLAVRPDARRRGFGATLLRDAATEAARTGAERMLLEVAANNATAAALYRGAGFREICWRRRYYPDGTDAVVMAAALPLF